MHRTTRLNVTDINQHFVCVICDGYIIDATTIVECLHSFCRTCIVRFLESSKFCPVCDVQVHKTKPLQSIRSDTTLQDVIYKLIPGLYQNEMHRRREFYADHPEAAAKCSTEERGEGAEQRCFYSPKENISLSLEYFKGSESQVESESTSETPDKDVMTRHLNCPAAMTVAHLKKFVRMKFSLPLTYMIKIMYAEHLLSDDYTLMDIAYIYSWRRAGPMKFFYTFAHRKHVAQRQTFPAIEEPTASEHPKQEESAVDVSVVMSTAVDDKIAQLPTPLDEPEKMDTEETAQPCATATCEPMQALDVPVSSTSATDSDKMDVSETKIPTPTTQNATPSPSEAPLPLPPSAVELSSAIVPVSSGIKLKLIQCPSEPKAAKSRKTAGGRKGGRTRYKSAPVPQRFPRLAPYPPPHQTAACLAMRKYNVPTVMTSIAPNLMLSFVPTTANSLCNMNSSNSNNPAILPTTVNSLCNMNTNNNGKPAMLPTTTNNMCNMNNGKPVILPTPTNSMCNLNSNNSSSKPSMLPTTVNSLCNMNNTNSSNPVILPAAVLPTMVNGQDKVPETPAPLCIGQDKKSPLSKNPDDQMQTSAIVTTEALAPRPAFYPLPQQQTVATTCVAPSPLGHLAVANSQAPFGVTSSLMAALISTTVGSTVSTSSPVYKMADMVNGSSKKRVASKGPEPSMPSILQTALCEDKTGKKSPKMASVAPPEAKVECNGGRTAPSPVSSDNKEFQFSPDKKTAFEMSVKNSISAEFSDNDDLGCQPDLVVDEQKMEEDNSEDEEEDDALRKKIAAIAEDNGQDEDSGRASDISSQARCSSCDDDSVPTTTSSTTTTCLPSFSLATSSSASSAAATPNRTSKSNNINHVINNLLLRNHERKDSMGALDLSTCTKTLGGPSRPKPVANPVLDIKHRQQAYLPAPNNSNNSNNNSNNSSKQHTACVPSPKHPILMHGLTSQGLTPLQLSAMHGKSPHLPVPPFHGTAMVYTSQSRTISSPTCVPSGRSPTPTYNTSPSVPSAHQAILSGNFPRMTALPPAMSSYPIRSATPTTSAMRNYGPMKGISISPSHNSKGTSLNTKSNHMMSPTHNSNHAKSMNCNNHLKGMSPSSSSPNSNHPSSRTFSPAANHIKGLASPPQNPYSKGSSKSHNPPAPSYKKSNFPVYSGGKKPPANPSYKSYNTKFKSSGNLTVINPDPNGSLHKLVIRNLDARPTSPQSQKL